MKACPSLAVFLLCVGVGSSQSILANDYPEPSTVSIPLSSLDIEEAVATVSVLQDPAGSANTLLGFCESKVLRGVEMEGEDLQGLIKKLCGAMKQLSREVSPPPTQGLSANHYLITVPLTQSEQKIHGVTWTANSLDEAIAFVELLKSGQLKAMKVLTHVPWGSQASRPCSECPISDLVFRVEAIKDKGRFLK